MDGQTIFAILIGAALACFSLAMVGYAFFRGDSPDDGTSAPLQPPSDDGVGLDAIYDSIETLELDFQLGNVPEQQYREQLQAYRLQAAAAIKALLERGDAPPELLLEREVLTARSGMRCPPFNSSPPGAGMEGGNRPPDGETKGGDWVACTQCDAPIPADDAPCPHCGAAVFGTSPLPSSDSPTQGRIEGEDG